MKHCESDKNRSSSSLGSSEKESEERLKEPRHCTEQSSSIKGVKDDNIDGKKEKHLFSSTDTFSRKRKLENDNSDSLKYIKDDAPSQGGEKVKMTVSRQRACISSYVSKCIGSLRKLKGHAEASNEKLHVCNSAGLNTKNTVRLEHLEPTGDVSDSRKHIANKNLGLTKERNRPFLKDMHSKALQRFSEVQKYLSYGTKSRMEHISTVSDSHDIKSSTANEEHKLILAWEKVQHKEKLQSKPESEAVFKAPSTSVGTCSKVFVLPCLETKRSPVCFKIAKKSPALLCSNISFDSGNKHGSSSRSKSFSELETQSKKLCTERLTEIVRSADKTESKQKTVIFKRCTEVHQIVPCSQDVASDSNSRKGHITANFKMDKNISQKFNQTKVIPSHIKATVDHGTLNIKDVRGICQKGIRSDVTPSDSKCGMKHIALDIKQDPRLRQNSFRTEAAPSVIKTKRDHTALQSDTETHQTPSILHTKRADSNNDIFLQVNPGSCRSTSSDIIPGSCVSVFPVTKESVQHGVSRWSTPSCMASEVPCPSTSHQHADNQEKEAPEISCSSASHQHADNQEEEMQIVEELQAARSEKKLEVSLQLKYGELTKMEIDSSDEVICGAGKSVTPDLFIVLDTNILLSHLAFIEFVKNNGISGVGFPVFVIPWVVLQELDAMKHGDLSWRIVKKANPAVHFIYTCLKQQDRQLRSQSMQLASQETRGLMTENNDDRVLQCCLQFQDLYPLALTMLCTDDKILSSKALASGVNAVNKMDLVPELTKLKSGSSLKYEDSPVVRATETDSRAAEQQTDKGMLPIVLSELEIPLGRALSTILETEMKNAFDKLWDEVILLKPPWTLSDLLECFMKHWFAVFGMIIPRNMRSCVEHIYNVFYKGKINDDDSVTSLLLKTASLLSAFSTRSNYGGALVEASSTVNKLLQTVSESSIKDRQADIPVSSRRVTHESTVTGTREKSVASSGTCGTTDSQAYKDLNKHQEIWALFENMWATIQKYSTAVFTTFSNGQCCVATDVTVQTLQPPDAFSCLQKLMEAVRTLQSGIQSILTPNSPLENTATLYNFLNNEMSVTDQFTAQELYECLTAQEYREKLTLGSGQLAEVLYNIEHCYMSILPEAKERGWV